MRPTFFRFVGRSCLAAAERRRCGASGGAVAVAYAVTTRRGIVRVSVSVAPSRTTVMLCL